MSKPTEKELELMKRYQRFGEQSDGTKQLVIGAMGHGPSGVSNEERHRRLGIEYNEPKKESEPQDS